MSAPWVRMLELFSGESGSGAGYHRAGWSVYVVDNDPERLAHNPFPSHLGDVIDVMARLLAGGAIEFTHRNGARVSLTLADFDAVHASPTCTGYSQGTVAIPDRMTRYDRLIGVTRALLVETGLPYVIENVYGARQELVDPILLCWTMFYAPGSVLDTDGTPLTTYRHRLFESNVPLTAPEHRPHATTPLPGTPRCACGAVHFQVAGLYGGARRDKYEARHVRHGGYVPASLDVLRALGDVPWMTERGVFHSIPPAYTQHIGRQLLAAVVERAA